MILQSSMAVARRLRVPARRTGLRMFARNSKDDQATHVRMNVALVGRPNVGKSTLFNRLTKNKNSAIVSDVPGTTRDRKIGQGTLSGVRMELVDTGGLDERDKLTTDIQSQVESAIVDSDVVLFMVDARAGITPLDRHYAQWIRRYIGQRSIDPQVVLVANKTEGTNLSDTVVESIGESHRLGLGEPLLLSASHGDGLADLATTLMHIEEDRIEKGLLPLDPNTVMSEEQREQQERQVQFALMGRPNVGKSTMVNAILGTDRVITGPTPGLTRDSVYIEWSFDDRHFCLVDTAGLRKLHRERRFLGKDMKPADNRGRMGSEYNKTASKKMDVAHRDDPSVFSLEVEEASLFSALRALRFSQVVVLVVEAGQGKFNKTDIAFGQRCLAEGRAMVIAANKSDLATVSHNEYERVVREQASHFFGDFGEMPIVNCSGLEGRGIARLLKTVTTVHDAWNMRAETWVLNQWLRDVIGFDPPPRVGGKMTKIKYITQIKARPPTFVLVTNQESLPQPYERFLTGKLRSDFGLHGVPMRLVVRKSKASTGESSRAETYKRRRRVAAQTQRGGRFK